MAKIHVCKDILLSSCELGLALSQSGPITILTIIKLRCKPISTAMLCTKHNHQNLDL